MLSYPLSRLYTRTNEYLYAQKLPEAVPIIKGYIKTVITTVFGDKPNIDSIVDSIYETENKVATLAKKPYLTKGTQNLDKNPIKLDESNENDFFIDLKSYLKQIYEFYNLNTDILDHLTIYNPYQELYEQLNLIMNELTTDDIVNYLEWMIINDNVFYRYIHFSEGLAEAYEEYSSNLDELYNKLSPEEFNEVFGRIDATVDLRDSYLDEETQKSNIRMNKFKSSNKRLHKKQITELDLDSTELDLDDIEFDLEEENNKKCLNYVEDFMPIAISKYFIQYYFKDDVKDEVEQMIKNIKETMMERIQTMEWLDQDTREYAKIKVEKMKDIIGYSDAILMSPKQLYQKYEKINITNVFDLEIQEKVSMQGLKLELLDDSAAEWYPTEVNAFYNPYKNSINFPIAILQDPFYNHHGQDYLNYGTVGSVIGHELTHAFDTTGKLYDANGQQANWWTDNDNEEYSDYAQCFIDQYNGLTFEYIDYTFKSLKHNVDGESSLGENLADNGGLARAYEAWQLSMLKNPEKAIERNQKLPGLENFTKDQLFYIAFGQTWCSINTIGILQDVHSPGSARVNGVVANSKQFAKAFNCPSNSAMNPENKCEIW